MVVRIALLEGAVTVLVVMVAVVAVVAVVVVVVAGVWARPKRRDFTFLVVLGTKCRSWTVLGFLF